MLNNINKMHLTVNSNFMRMFKDMSKLWWKDNASLKILHRLNEVRAPWLINTIKEAQSSAETLRNSSILDVGCGGGFLTEALTGLGCNIVGIDPCSELINVAKDRLKIKPEIVNLNYISQAIEEHSKTNFENYDFIVTSQVLPFVDRPDLFIQKCVECLKPGGSIFITTTNRNFMAWVVTKYFYLTNSDIPAGYFEWRRNNTPEEIEQYLAACKCRVESIQEIKYNFSSKTWSWSDVGSMVFALHAIKSAELFATRYSAIAGRQFSPSNIIVIETSLLSDMFVI